MDLVSVPIPIWGGFVSKRATYESFRGHISRGETTGSLVGINNQPRGAVLEEPLIILWVHAQGFKKETPYDLIQTLRSTQTSWACTNDENINGTGAKQSVSSWPARGGWVG